MTPASSPAGPVNLDVVLASFDEVYSPRIVQHVNDYDVRVVKVQGDFVWHRHPETDEFFLVLGGTLDLAVRDPEGDRTIRMTAGDTYVVPRDVLHQPSSAAGATVVLVEPTGTLTTGDYDGEIPDHIDSTVGHEVGAR